MKRKTFEYQVSLILVAQHHIEDDSIIQNENRNVVRRKM